MAVTMKQIAELANVSRGTVDRVLNNRGNVKPEVQKRIQEIAETLNYQPNIIGKSLVASNSPKKIGIILTSENNMFINEVKKGIDEALKEYSSFGITVTVRYLPFYEPYAQLHILEEFEKNGYDGIALIPLDDICIKNKINGLMQKGIAVITLNSFLHGTDILCHIGQNHTIGGFCAGGLICRLLPANSAVGIIISSPALACHQNRLDGFRSKCSGLHIVGIKENADRDDYAFQCGLELINQYPDLSGIYITGGGINGLCKALRLTKRNTQIKVISHDFLPCTKELLNEGILSFAIGQNASLHGFQTIKIFFNYFLKREKPNNIIIDIPLDIATEDNIDQLYNTIS